MPYSVTVDKLLTLDKDYAALNLTKKIDLMNLDVAVNRVRITSELVNATGCVTEEAAGAGVMLRLAVRWSE